MYSLTISIFGPGELKTKVVMVSGQILSVPRTLIAYFLWGKFTKMMKQ